MPWWRAGCFLLCYPNRGTIADRLFVRLCLNWRVWERMSYGKLAKWAITTWCFVCICFTREVSPCVQTRLKVAGGFGGTGGSNCGVKWKQQNRGMNCSPAFGIYKTRLHVDYRIVLERSLFFTLLWIQQNLKTDSLKEFFWFLWEWLMRWNPAHRQESWVINKKHLSRRKFSET